MSTSIATAAYVLSQGQFIHLLQLNLIESPFNIFDVKIFRTVTISNRSDIIVQFKWSNFATLREELQQKDRYYVSGES